MKLIIAIFASVGILANPVVTYNEKSSSSKILYYNKDRKLSWDDFKRASNGDGYAAEIHCGIDLNVGLSDGEVSVVEVLCHMNRQTSWVVKSQMTERVLRHEQGHFDIADKYSRILIDRIRGLRSEQKIYEVYDSVMKEYQDCQERYDSETNHGVDIPQQRKWEYWISPN